MAICVLITPAAETLVGLRICASKVTGQCGIKISCAGSEGSGESAHLHSNEIACACSNGDLCAVYVNSKCCGVSAPATTAHLCNHQCIVTMRQKMPTVRCNKIPQ